MSSFFSQIDAKKLFDASYIFQSIPDPEGLYKNLSFVFVLMLLLALILKVFIKKPNEIFIRIRNKLFNLFLTIGIIGLIWIFCRYEKIPFVGSRFVFILIILSFFIWSLAIIWYKIFILPKEIIKIKQLEKYKKYLPKHKKGNK